MRETLRGRVRGYCLPLLSPRPDPMGGGGVLFPVPLMMHHHFAPCLAVEEEQGGDYAPLLVFSVSNQS
ncbi:hypothetical protein U0070_002194 [Myodes glareolus]|uniref:Uncharacterized protein n=1 Tax=Myodes glareolus TaxID=447135 RepID=A0AAW0JPR2_MYOGA